MCNILSLRPLRLVGFSYFSLRSLRLWLFLLLLWTQTHAQYNSTFVHYSKTGRSISINGDYEAGSNGMSGNIGNRLLWGGYISDETKDESSRYLKGRNNFGVSVNYDVSAFLKGGKKFDYVVGIKNQEVLNASFTDDFFNFVFRGNNYFRGATADFSNCSVNALRFQEFKFGAMLHHVDTLGKIGISVSVLKGEQLLYLSTGENASLYTAPGGDEIIFNSNFNLALSDTNNKGIEGINGLGASADLYFETPYKGKLGRRSVLTVNANNIGFIHWWQNSVQYSSDTSLSFTGLTIRSLADLTDSTLSRINRDTLMRGLVNARNENFNVNIPANLVLINKSFFGKDERTAFSFGFRYIFNANYKGYIFIEPEHRFRNVTLTLHTGYGGYARLNVGACLTWTAKSWFMRLGSNAVQGFFFPSQVFSESVYFSFARRLR